MKNLNNLILLIFFVSLLGFSQENVRSIRDIISNPYYKENKKLMFNDIVEEADAFFKIKYPDLSPYDLSSGTHRDGDFVKYQRWKNFWKYRLNSDGTLGDISIINNSNPKSTALQCDDSEFDVSWSEVNYNGNFGVQIDMGRVSSLGFHPTDANTFLVGAAFGGLWKTTNGGQSYVNLNNNLPHTSVSDIIIDSNDPDRIFISLSDIVWYGPSGIGVYESTDGGANFLPTALTFTLPQNIRIYEMDVNPNNPAEFLVATSDGLYRTTDYFASVSKVISADIRAVKYSLNNNFAFAGGASGQYFLSTNSGASFSLNNDFGNGQVRIAISNMSNSGYVAVTNGVNLNVSSDGQNFTQSLLPESNCVVSFSNNQDSNLLIGNFECYRSNDFGNSFFTTTNWLGNGLQVVHVDQRNIYTNPLQSDYVYYCNDGGVFRYSVSTNSFENISSDLFITQYYDIAVSQTDANVLGGGSQDNGNITRNSNGEWQSYDPTGDGMGQEIDFNDSNRRYFSFQFGSLRRWNSLFGSPTNIAPSGEDGNGAWETPYKLDPNNSDRIIIGYKNVYASENRGATWSVIGNNISTSNLEQIAIAKSNSNKIYASQFNTVFEKDALSNTWSSHSTPVNQYISDLEVHPTNENTVFISYSGFTSNSKVYRSLNGGFTWENISYNLPNLPVLSLETYDTIEGMIFIGTYSGVYYLEENATEWKKLGCLPNTSVNDIEIQYLNGDKIFAGTHGRGIFEAPLSDFRASLSIDDVDYSAESAFKIFPNPAENKVYFSKAVEANTISIIDIRGRIVNTKFNKDGVENISEINISPLLKGVYFIILETDNNKIVRKLVKN
ncbi:T9SS type A sorting domain-containing protein [uncultured Winogradskyella sp.]|uniref:T9SS type A sorting domain-containing protein n=1 Tax=uncultured Winogradskyella sp. TaxID=395353 RepID=UPI002637B3A1|nr:T9SS type A sorting domain-containing protein [uncultured Winogradskyella sp.]